MSSPAQAEGAIRTEAGNAPAGQAVQRRAWDRVANAIESHTPHTGRDTIVSG